MRLPNALEKLWPKKPHEPPPYQSFALFEDQLFFPTIAITPNGVFREVDPVLVIPPTRDALAAALKQALERQRPKVKEYRRGDPALKSPVQLAAKCRSWISFARASVRYGVGQSEKASFISTSVGPTPDASKVQQLPRDSSVESLAGVAMELANRYPLWRAPLQADREKGGRRRRRTRG